MGQRDPGVPPDGSLGDERPASKALELKMDLAVAVVADDRFHQVIELDVGRQDALNDVGDDDLVPDLIDDSRLSHVYTPFHSDYQQTPVELSVNPRDPGIFPETKIRPSGVRSHQFQANDDLTLPTASAT